MFWFLPWYLEQQKFEIRTSIARILSEQFSFSGPLWNIQLFLKLIWAFSLFLLFFGFGENWRINNCQLNQKTDVFLQSCSAFNKLANSLKATNSDKNVVCKLLFTFVSFLLCWSLFDLEGPDCIFQETGLVLSLLFVSIGVQFLSWVRF